MQGGRVGGAGAMGTRVTLEHSLGWVPGKTQQPPLRGKPRSPSAGPGRAERQPRKGERLRGGAGSPSGRPG